MLERRQSFRDILLGDLIKHTMQQPQIIQSTVGIDFNVKDVNKNGLYYRLQMWDTAGQERYRSLIPTYLKNAHCVVFVYDVTKAKSLENIAIWHKLFTDYQQAPGIMVANKVDLATARLVCCYDRKVNRGQAEQLSKKLGVKYMQVSAKTGKKISQLFDVVIEMIN